MGQESSRGSRPRYGGEPDFQGDVVEFGAFADSIIRWRQLGDFPPVGLNHDYTSASSRIGKLTSMQEIDEGLLVSGQLNLKSDAAMAAYEAMLTGALDAMSIGYAVLEQHKRDDGKVNVLTKLDLIEVSLTPVPANPRARVLAVKSLTDITQVADRRLVHCSSCGRFVTVEVRTSPVPGTILIGTTPCCGILYGWTPKALSTALHVGYMKIVRAALERGEQAWTLLSAMRDAGAPPAVLDSALMSAKWFVESPDYSLEEFGERLHGIIANHTEPDEKIRADGDLAGALDALEGWADSNTSEKGEKHRLLSAMNAAGLAIRLRDTVECRVGVETITGSVADIGEPGILVAVGAERYLVQPDDVLSANSDLSRAVDEMVASVRAEKAQQEADRKWFQLQEEQLLAGSKPAGFEPDLDAERDAERRQREDADRERRSAERDAERAAANAADDARRDRGWRRAASGAEYYVESQGAEINPRSERTYPEPRVTQGVPGLGESFRVETAPQEREHYRLEPEPKAQLPETTATETFRAPLSTVDGGVPLEVDADRFSIPMIARELPAVVAAEQPIPTPVEKVGDEVVRLPIGGGVRAEIHVTAADDGETVRLPKAGRPDGGRTVEK